MERDEINIAELAAEDFCGSRVFEWLENIQSGYQRTQAEYDLRDRAKELKVSGFPQRLKAYRQELKKIGSMVLRDDGYSEFAEQELDLNVGQWTADDTGIWKYGQTGQQIFACSHPVMPVQLLRSIDTGLMKVKLIYRRTYSGNLPWSEIIVPVSKISKAADIE